jgi:Arc/MetJ-type ribon-helix-helix transcriptional regulator
MVFHDEVIQLRIKKEFSLKIDKLVRKNPDKFDSSSHFVRCAIIRLLREYKAIPVETPTKSYSKNARLAR